MSSKINLSDIVSGDGIIDAPTNTITCLYDKDGNLVEQRVHLQPRQPSSVSLSTDSKGSIKPEVKVYHEDPQKAMNEALRIYKEIQKRVEKLR